MGLKELNLEFKSIKIILKEHMLDDYVLKLDRNDCGYNLILVSEIHCEERPMYNYERLSCREMTQYIKGIRHGMSISKESIW